MLLLGKRGRGREGGGEREGERGRGREGGGEREGERGGGERRGREEGKKTEERGKGVGKS